MQAPSDYGGTPANEEAPLKRLSYESDGMSTLTTSSLRALTASPSYSSDSALYESPASVKSSPATQEGRSQSVRSAGQQGTPKNDLPLVGADNQEPSIAVPRESQKVAETVSAGIIRAESELSSKVGPEPSPRSGATSLAKIAPITVEKPMSSPAAQGMNTDLDTLTGHHSLSPASKGLASEVQSATPPDALVLKDVNKDIPALRIPEVSPTWLFPEIPPAELLLNIVAWEPLRKPQTTSLLPKTVDFSEESYLAKLLGISDLDETPSYLRGGPDHPTGSVTTDSLGLARGCLLPLDCFAASATPGNALDSLSLLRMDTPHPGYALTPEHSHLTSSGRLPYFQLPGDADRGTENGSSLQTLEKGGTALADGWEDGDSKKVEESCFC